MELVRTTISVSGLDDAEVAEGMQAFREYLGEREWLINPEAEWDSAQRRLRVTMEIEGDEEKSASLFAFDEVWDCVIAAFQVSETISFDIVEAVKVS
jgi:hypothetical protein